MLKSNTGKTGPREAVDESDVLQILLRRLDQIEAKLQIDPKGEREYFSVSEAAELLGKATFTVREWCRLERINARKRPSGRGRSLEWMISAKEIQRIIDQGLLPRDL
ncbi:helix-turn-helix domain-containing protein [Aureliella helgolandensis]|uniref:Helix-turn-helix domain protein n=1 Tax=Aureliella helgolandensis TaxID=2527968 RepID=A0A518GBW5_9BACT|nr:helix-turn-helix domain-containing protein [Aureliella helgolandensis]QDV26088.1 Helix-turn-helix domain protein [Aureliella helgolandensis]